MATYLEKWAMDVLRRPSAVLSQPVAVTGTRFSHLGPRMESARVALLVEPATTLEVIVPLTVSASLRPAEHDFIDGAVFGFLDVVLLAEPHPYRALRVTISRLDIDPIDSSMNAFRHAGRAAGREFLAAALSVIPPS